MTKPESGSGGVVQSVLVSRTKKDGFNLVTERVVAFNPEAKQLKVELHTYDGKTVVLAVGDELLG